MFTINLKKLTLIELIFGYNNCTYLSLNLKMDLSMEQHTPEYLINKLSLIKHPEGGYYKLTYKSTETVSVESMPTRFTIDHSYSTGIFYFLEKNDFSAFHRIKQDEMWHFYYGSPLNIHVIDNNEKYSCIKLGVNFENGEIPQAVVNAGYFFAAEVCDKKLYSLVGCTVSPGFEFEDFEMPDRATLIKQFPQHLKIIENFTR